MCSFKTCSKLALVGQPHLSLEAALEAVMHFKVIFAPLQAIIWSLTIRVEFGHFGERKAEKCISPPKNTHRLYSAIGKGPENGPQFLRGLSSINADISHPFKYSILNDSGKKGR